MGIDIKSDTARMNKTEIHRLIMLPPSSLIVPDWHGQEAD